MYQNVIKCLLKLYQICIKMLSNMYNAQVYCGKLLRFAGFFEQISMFVLLISSKSKRALYV